jgi:NAD+ kinase
VTRSVLVVAHTGRAVITDAARHAIRRLQEAGVHVRALAEEVSDLGLSGIELCDGGSGSAADAELVLVLGGDGSILRAAELARAASVPLLGVNLGRVGFLAEAESEDLDTTLDRVLDRDYAVEERLTLDVRIVEHGVVVDSGWALNECSLEKAARERMLEVVVEVDGRPLSRWGCDGVVAATPTGSTAYAFSAGGPVVWPTVEALLVVPISAHALFSRPMVAAPSSVHRARGAAQRDDGRPRLRRPPHGDRPARCPGRGARGSDPVSAREDAGQAVHRHPGPQVRAPGRGLARRAGTPVGDLPETVAGPT